MAEYDAMDRDDHPGEGAGEGDRVAKALARAGVASRREVERLIEAGRVAINGTVLTTPAVKIAPGDILTVDGEVVGDAEPTRLFRYHKPVGLVTSHNDPGGRPTVFAALPPGLPRLISIGRLDLNSEGLLLLTNDGALSRALELPSSDWPRVYRARAFGDATQEKLDRLKAGVTVEGVKYGPIEARLDKARDGTQGRNVWITVTLTEGKNREVRRVLESLGLKVNRLLRLAYGPFALGDLGVGQVEEIGPRVIREQLVGLVAEENMPTGERPQFAGTQGKTPGRRAPTAGKGETLSLGGRRTAPAEPKPKTEYKPGWAKPKPRANPHAPSKAAPRSDRTKTDKPKHWVDASPSKAKIEGKTFTRPDGAPKLYGKPAPARGPATRDPEGRGRKGRVFARAEDLLPGQTPKGLVRAPAKEPERRGPKDGPGRPAGKSSARPADGKRNPKAQGPRPAGKAFARPPEAPRGDPAETPYERARKEFGDRRPSAARPDSPPRRDDATQRPRGPRPDGPRAEAPRSEGPRSDRARPGAKGAFVKGGAHRSEAPKSGPKPSGPRPPARRGPPSAAGPKGPPRGPKPR